HDDLLAGLRLELPDLRVDRRDRARREQVRIVDDVAAARERRADGRRDGDEKGGERRRRFHGRACPPLRDTGPRDRSCDAADSAAYRPLVAMKTTPTEVSTKIARTIQTKPFTIPLNARPWR